LGAALLRGLQQAVVARRDPGLGRGAGQQVAGELLGRELVERLVGVEGVDDVIAVRGQVAVIVAVVAAGVGVAYQVEPVHRQPLAEVRRGQQAVDQPLVGVRRCIRKELVHLLRAGW